MAQLSRATKIVSATPATSTDCTVVQERKLGIYAQKFVPSWLKDINSAPALRVWSVAPAYVDFEEYAQTFLPKQLFEQCSSTMFLAPIRLNDPLYALDALPLGPQIPIRKLDLRNYTTHFRNTLIEERLALAQEFKQYNLYEAKLEFKQYNMYEAKPEFNRPKYHEYEITVPGLREYLPPVYVGDCVLVRPIRRLVPGYFDGVEYVACIWAIDRSNVLIVVITSKFRKFCD